VLYGYLLQIIAFMVLAIISACLAGAMFCVSLSGSFIGGGDKHPEVPVSRRVKVPLAVICYELNNTAGIHSHCINILLV